MPRRPSAMHAGAWHPPAPPPVALSLRFFSFFSWRCTASSTMAPARATAWCVVARRLAACPAGDTPGWGGGWNRQRRLRVQAAGQTHAPPQPLARRLATRGQTHRSLAPHTHAAGQRAALAAPPPVSHPPPPAAKHGGPAGSHPPGGDPHPPRAAAEPRWAACRAAAGAHGLVMEAIRGVGGRSAGFALPPCSPWGAHGGGQGSGGEGARRTSADRRWRRVGWRH